ncbi:MAG: hypothetical protein IMF08_16580 [Proteobacteria bacterium]|nr:hypothetical protein [Pseudomonadota bacterium]
MSIICPCCGLRFIVCAAHLMPDGRTVLCLNCATRWAMPAGGTAAPRPTVTLSGGAPRPTVTLSGGAPRPAIRTGA